MTTNRTDYFFFGFFFFGGGVGGTALKEILKDPL